MQTENIYIAGIGASAGGLRSIIDFLKNLPPDSGVAYVIILHLPRNSESTLAEALRRYTPMPVHAIDHNLIPLPNHVYVLPGQFKVRIEHGVLVPEPRGPEKVNQVIDDFLISLAKERKELAIGIIFSGMLRNGAAGVKAIHENRGIVLVENPLDAQFGSMPVAAINETHPDKIDKPATLASEIKMIIKDRR